MERALSSSSGVQGEAPAEIDLSTFSTLYTLSPEVKATFVNKKASIR